MNKNSALETANVCAEAAYDKKAENIRILALSEISSMADYFVICSAISDRQVRTIADHIHDKAAQNGRVCQSVEGASEGRWVLLDYGDVVVHVFIDALRDYYDLEGLWKQAPRVKLPESFFEPAARHT